MSVVYYENWSYFSQKIRVTRYVFPLNFLLNFLDPEIPEGSFYDNGIL